MLAPSTVLVERLKSPNGDTEITLWHEEPAGILDSSMMLTINKPGASFSPGDIKAMIKRGREVEAYWTAHGQPVLSVRDLDGWISSAPRSPSFVVCGLPHRTCTVTLPPNPLGKSIRLGTYHSGESAPFEEAAAAAN